MTDDMTYEFTKAEKNSKVGVIKLHRQVLGGNDALSFTSALKCVQSGDVSVLAVEMTAVELINSSGLGMLVSGLSTLKKQNINVVLASVPEKVQSLLAVTHLDKVFKVYSSIDSVCEDVK